MFVIDIRPDSLSEELLAYSRTLSQGMETLLNAGPIDTGVSPRYPVYSEDKLVLYRYAAPEAVEQNPVPLLIVYALVNRPYILDLVEDRSAIKGLLATGQDVYLIDWGYPDSADCPLTLDDYINGYIDRCVDFVCETHGVDRINLLGICQGGTFSLCYTALHPDKVKNIITMVTPVDFKTPDDLLSSWIQGIDVDLAVDIMGNIPGEFLSLTYLFQKPFTRMGQMYVAMADLLDNRDMTKGFLSMEKWVFDNPDQAGETFRQFIKDFYQRNVFRDGGVWLGDRNVDLKEIRCPLLNVYAERDEVVPPAASKALNGLTSSPDYTELAFPCGHIRIFVDREVQGSLAPAVGSWLNHRS